MNQNARRYSIYLKNVPADKLDLASISEYFKKNFGDIQSIRLFEEKRACSIKFKSIESAEKAAKQAQFSAVWDDSNIKLIYNVGGVPVVPASAQKQAPSTPTHQKPQKTPEEIEKEKKREQLKAEIESKRKLLLEKYNKDLQNGLRQLSESGLTPEKTAEIEKKIKLSKEKIREISSA